MMRRGTGQNYPCDVNVTADGLCGDTWCFSPSLQSKLKKTIQQEMKKMQSRILAKCVRIVSSNFLRSDIALYQNNIIQWSQLSYQH